MNEIRTWAQGYFVDQRQYDDWTEEEKAAANAREKHLVRPYPTGNAICQCPNPEDAQWIASRLNLASKLEQMTYDFATGKTDGEEIVELVKRNIEIM
jgi:hypothetical protein